MSVDTVVFDVGNVLIAWDPRNLYRRLIPNEPDMEHFLENVATMGWNIEQDRGRSWKEGVDHLVALHPQHASLIRAYDEQWHEMIPGVIQGSVDILHRLQGAGIPVYAITNFSAEKWVLACERFDFLNSFKDVVVSAHERLLKPDAVIYNRLLERNRLEAGQCVFIDDSEKNVRGAQVVGMKGVHFSNAEHLAQELRLLGFDV